MAKLDLRSWAAKGAEQRLVEIAAEARTIFTAFPELRGGGRGFEASPAGADRGAARQRAPRKGRKRSAEARRRMSEAQKARWAKHRRAHSAVAAPRVAAKKK